MINKFLEKEIEYAFENQLENVFSQYGYIPLTDSKTILKKAVEFTLNKCQKKHNKFVEKLREAFGNKIKIYHDEKLRFSKERSIAKKKKKSWVEIGTLTDLYKRAEIVESILIKFQKEIFK